MIQMIDIDETILNKIDPNRTMINIYEIAHYCKKYASSVGIQLHSWLHNCEIRDARGMFEKKFTANTEEEAIFAATAYIINKIKFG